MFNNAGKSMHRLASMSLAGAALFALSGPLSAQCLIEPPVDNHQGGGTVAVPGFVAGEEVGAIFDVPASHYPIEITEIRVGWGSILGGNPAQLEQALKIYPAGLPNPGVEQWSVAGPQLTDGFINAFDITLIPGNKTLTSGPFTVTLELMNNSTIFGPAPVHDGNGCNPGTGVIKAIPGGWSSSCALGVTGDWVFGITYRQVTNFCETPPEISLGAGGAQIMNIQAGVANAGRWFWTLGSATGTAGFPTTGPPLPLTFDVYTNLTIFRANKPPLSNSAGLLNAAGESATVFTVPPGSDPALAGAVLYHATAVFSDVFVTVDWVSDPGVLTFVP